MTLERSAWLHGGVICEHCCLSVSSPGFISMIGSLLYEVACFSCACKSVFLFFSVKNSFSFKTYVEVIFFYQKGSVLYSFVFSVLYE